MSILNEIVKAYDVRGTIPDQMNDDVAYALGVGFAEFTKAPKVVVARDMRQSGVALAAAFMRGVNDVGVSVIDIGLASTDMLYFASGSMDLPGAMITASHNPAQYNGFKLCQSGARPIGIDSGLAEIQQMADRVLEGDDSHRSVTTGTVEERDVLDDFVDHVVSFIDITKLKPLKVVADTANGMGGLVVPALFKRLEGIELEMMYGELDGTFPNHPADPLQPANQTDLRARMAGGEFDVGLAFDGDADRVFIVDEQGNGMSGSTTTALLASGVLRNHPGETVLYNLICSRAVPEVVEESGGVGVRTKVGHSNIKAIMAETNAVFGGEHSAHYYFRNNYRADSGLIATVFMLEEMSRTDQPLSELRKPFERYAASGEINTHVDDPRAVITRVAEQFVEHPQDTLDGLSIDCGDYWFNLRPSNTEPVLRLNLEAVDRDVCDARVAELLAIITS